MLRCAIVARAQQVPQQRLFTGALFPEHVNAELHAFAQRHSLHSRVWVPQKAFDTALRPYSVYMLPSACLCDITVATGCEYGETVAAIGYERLLVNADHTSNPRFFEMFRDLLTFRSPSDVLSTKTSDGSGFSNNNNNSNNHIIKPWISLCDGAGKQKDTRTLYCAGKATGGLAVAPFRFPLSISGALLSDPTLWRQLMAYRKKRGFESPYWVRGSARHRRGIYFNAEETEHPGRFSPSYCISYYPRTYTNVSFPTPIVRLMRQRAVQYGYVSRTWVTLAQATELFGVTLRPERAKDVPAVVCGHLSAGLQPEEYYCADQFESPDGADVFPTTREVQLASSGVRIPPQKLRAFPALLAVFMPSCASVDVDATTTTTTNVGSSLFSDCHLDRRGADIAMSDAARYTRYMDLLRRYDDIELIGPFTRRHRHYLLHGRGATTHSLAFTRKKRLERPTLAEELRRQCILQGFPSACFVSSRTIWDYELAVRPHEQGVVHAHTSVTDSFSTAAGGRVHFAEECWFNIAQLAEPQLALELHRRPPRHFFTRSRMTQRIAGRCARLQMLLHSRKESVLASATTSSASKAAATTVGSCDDSTCPSPTHTKKASTASQHCDKASAVTVSSEYIPLYIIWELGWGLHEGATGVPYTTSATANAHAHFKTYGSVLFNIEDVILPETTLSPPKLKAKGRRRRQYCRSRGKDKHAVPRSDDRATAEPEPEPDPPAWDLDWMRRYRPVDEKGRPYLRSVRMHFLLRAYERGYTSPVWVCVGKAGCVTPETNTKYVCRDTPKPIRSGVKSLSTLHAFGQAPYVVTRTRRFVNAEELVDPVTLAESSLETTASPLDTCTESLEALLDMAACAEEGTEEKDAEDVAAAARRLQDIKELEEEGRGESAESYLTSFAEESLRESGAGSLHVGGFNKDKIWTYGMYQEEDEGDDVDSYSKHE